MRLHRKIVIFLLVVIFNLYFLFNAKAENANHKVYIFFTCDVESLSKGDPEKDIWGRRGNEHWGITRIMDILEKHGVKGTFFVNVYEANKFGEGELKKSCQEIDKRGHGVELHTHPQTMFPKIYGLQDGDLLTQIEIIKKGKELIYKWIGKDVIAHRAGGYLANYNSFTACYKNGILMDSSMNYCVPSQGLMHPVFAINQVKIFYPENNENLNKPYYLEGVLEIPVTTYDQFHFDTFVSRRFLDIEATSLEEFKKIFHSAIYNRIKTTVIMSHSFSFSRYKAPITRLKLERKLDDLLSYINSQQELELITFQDFFNLYKKDPTIIESNSFIPTTGIWLTYLRSWERLDQGYKNILFAFTPIVFSIVIITIFYSKSFKKNIQTQMFLNNKKSMTLPILCMLFIFILSSVPVDENERLGGVIYIKPTIQNLLHFPLYGLLAFLWMRAFNNKQIRLKKAIVYTLIITVFYSVFDEFYQYFIPGRYASLGDFFFNTIGCLGGVTVYYRLVG